MKFKYLLLILTLLIANQGFSQLTFQNNYTLDSTSFHFTDLAVVENNNYVVCGWIERKEYGFEKNNQALLIKFDQVGNTIWSKRIFSKGNGQRFNSVAVDSLGNIYVTGFCGWQDSYGNMPTTAVSMVVAKFDKQGNNLWSKSFYSVNKGLGIKILKTGTNHLLITGEIDVNSSYIMKIDLDGNLQWYKKFEYAYAESRPFRDVKVDKEGFIYLLGGNRRVYLKKLDKKGDEVWDVVFNHRYYEPKGKSLHIKDDGGIVLVGSITSTMSYYWREAMFVAELDNKGNMLWFKEYISKNDIAIWGYDIEAIDDNQYLVSGVLDPSGTIILKIDSLGTMLSNIYHSGYRRSVPYGSLEAGATIKNLNNGTAVSITNNVDGVKEEASLISFTM